MKISVEPVLFLFLFGMMQILPTFQELLLEKACIFYEKDVSYWY